MRETMRKMLKENGAPPEGRFADLKYLEPVRDYKARHASTMLTFDAVVDAIGQIETKRAEASSLAVGRDGTEFRFDPVGKRLRRPAEAIEARRHEPVRAARHFDIERTHEISEAQVVALHRTIAKRDAVSEFGRLHAPAPRRHRSALAAARDRESLTAWNHCAQPSRFTSCSKV